MPAGKVLNPYCAYNFLVEIDGLPIAGFMECQGLESETQVIEYREGGDSELGVRKLPGRTKYANLILKRGVSASKDLYNWRKATTSGMVQRKMISLLLLDESRQEVARWLFHGCWPCRMSGPALHAMKNAVAIEELEICHEGFERV